MLALLLTRPSALASPLRPSRAGASPSRISPLLLAARPAVPPLPSNASHTPTSTGTHFSQLPCEPPRDKYAHSGSFESRSTARPIDDTPYLAPGYQERRERLHAALSDVGFTELDALLSEPAFRGSAALRMYSSFLYPKSQAALQETEKPQRAATIASSIFFMVAHSSACLSRLLFSSMRRIPPPSPSFAL